MKKIAIILGCAVILVGTMVSLGMAGGGFDEYGYNYNARLFNGLGANADRNFEPEGLYWDYYVDDSHLVMKWSKGWDEARFHDGEWGPGCWENNQWVGKYEGSDGKQHTWTYYCMIVWIGDADLPEGAIRIWGSFAIIHQVWNDPFGECPFTDVFVAPGEQFVAQPAGPGAYKRME